MNTTIKAALRADWAPAIKSTARLIGVAVAVLIVAADWLAFTWRRPVDGLLALVPVRLKSVAAGSSPNLAVSSPNLVSSALVRAGASVVETELGPMSLRMDFGMARPIKHLDPLVLAPAPRKRGRRATRQPKAE